MILRYIQEPEFSERTEKPIRVSCEDTLSLSIRADKIRVIFTIKNDKTGIDIVGTCFSSCSNRINMPACRESASNNEISYFFPSR